MPAETFLRLVSRDVVATEVTLEHGLAAARESALAASTGEVSSERVSLMWGSGWVRIMVATLPRLDLWGYKEFHLVEGDGVRYACHLFRLSTGEPLGIVDASLVTAIRTSCTAALAITAHFGISPIHVGIVGSGAEAREGLRVLKSTGSVIDARVTSPTVAHRDAFATEMSDELGLPVEAMTSVEDVAEGADVLYAATNSRGRIVIEFEDVARVPFVASLGSTLPSQRELAADIPCRAGVVIVDTKEALTESGDMLAAASTGEFDAARVGLLGATLQTGPESFRTQPGPILYKSIGTPEQDLVLAYRILMLAADRGLGRLIEPIASLKRDL